MISHIRNFLTYAGPRRERARIAFYGGNFLGLERDRIRCLLDTAALFVADGTVAAIRFSTRPDTIHPETLDLLAGYPVTTIELGVQSMHDQVLAQSRRGHSAGDTCRAVNLLRERGYEIGLQIMVGLPGDTRERAMVTARRIIRLSPDFVRIYPTLVLANSPLARWYEDGRYRPLGLDEGVSLVQKIFLLLKGGNIPVARMGLQPSTDLEDRSVLLAGPYHPAFGHLVHSAIFLEMADSLVKKRSPAFDAITLKVHPRSIPKMTGFKGTNIIRLKEKHHLRAVKIIPDNALAEDRVIVL